MIELRAAFDVPHAFVQVPGGRLARWTFGEGPDVVAVHGWPLHSATFRTLLPHLVPHLRVHLFDMPGTGRTEWSGPIGFEENARALRAGIDALRLGRYGLLAHDSGGAIARLVAADDPRVAALVLSGTEIPGNRSALLRAYVVAARLPGAARLLSSGLQIGPLRRSRIALGACFEDPAYGEGEFADLFVRPLADMRVARGQTRLLADLRFPFLDALASVHARILAPTLCVWGEADPFFPVDLARAMLPQFAGGATLEAVPGAKLFVHEDHPREVAEHVRPFLLARLGAPARSHAAA